MAGYYQALMDAWPTLGGDPIDPAFLSACQAAWATPAPVEPYPVDGNPDLSRQNSERWHAELNAWHQSWSCAFTQPATLARLATLNARTVPGPGRDVPCVEVFALLATSGAYLTLQAFAAGSYTGDATHDHALVAAKLLTATLNNPNTPTFRMTDPGTNAAMARSLGALLAQETAVPGSTGITQEVHDSLMALDATTIPWWKSVGYSSPISPSDLEAIMVQSDGSVWLT
jgi:hypothetical protein